MLSERIIPPSSINIHNPDKMTQDTLAQIVSQCEEGAFGITSSTILCLYIQKDLFFKSQRFNVNNKSTVNMIPALTMGCTVSSRE